MDRKWRKVRREIAVLEDEKGEDLEMESRIEEGKEGKLHQRERCVVQDEDWDDKERWRAGWKWEGKEATSRGRHENYGV